MKSDLLLTKLIDEVKSKLPTGVNTASVLSDILSLGKEAIYRRLRGEVPFTFTEVAQISSKLDISLNDIVDSSITDGGLFRLYDIRFLNPREYDYRHYAECNKALKAIEDDPHSELGSSSNTLPQNLLIPYDNLAKFCRFKWQYQCGSPAEPILPFHEITIPDRLKECEKIFVTGMNNIKNVTYIWDRMVFEYLVNDIKYFSQVNLLRDEDMRQLKEELLSLIDDIEMIAVNGRNCAGNKVNIYIANTNFETTYTYAQGHGKKLSLIRVFTLNTASSSDGITFDRLKSWILSLRRLSILISECGEMQRVQFFRKQRELVNSIVIPERIYLEKKVVQSSATPV